MKKIFITLILFLAAPVFAAVELDTDRNGATDISRGGTNSTTISGAKANLGIPSTLSALAGDTTHRVVTDAQIGIWDSKQPALTAGTDYLTPNGSAAGLTNFPATLATDLEVTTAVSGKANTSAFASPEAFQAAFGWIPSGTFDTAANQTITGDWVFSSGLEVLNISYNLGTLADLKIGNAQMVDDTKGNGDTNFLWSADKVFDQLATKQATLVSGTNIKTINGNSLVGSGDLTISGGTGTSGYVALSATPYSDVACTTGQYGYYGSTAYLCTGGFWASKWMLTAHSNPTPVTYSLTVTPSGFTGADKFTYSATDYTTEQVFSGLTADASFTVTPDTGRDITCSGAGLTDNTGGSYTSNTDTANVVATCTSTSIVCSTSTDSGLISQTSNDQTPQITATAWGAQSISLASNSTITEYTLYIRRDTSGLGNVTVALYTDNAGNPGSEISGTAVTVADSSLSGTIGNYNFTLASTYSASAGNYHLVIKTTGTALVSVGRNSTSLVSGNYEYTTNSGASWSDMAAGDMRFTLNGCTP